MSHPRPGWPGRRPAAAGGPRGSPCHRRRHGPRPDRGQATVELALCLPAILLALLLVVQIALVVAGHVATVHAAREAARVVAVDGRAGAADAAVAGTGRRGCTAAVDRPAAPGQVLTVVVTCPVPTDVPLVGPLVPEVEARATAAMRVER